MRAAIALIVIIAACGCAKTDRPIAIRLVGEPSTAFSAFIDLKSEYEAQTGVRVDIATVDRAGLLAALARNADAPPDLAVVPHHLLGRLVADDAVHRIKSFIDDLKLFDPRIVDPQIDLLPWWRELSQYRRQIYGYPATFTTTRPGLFFSWLAFAYASGARIMDSRSGDTYGPIVVNSPNAIQATERFVALQRRNGGTGGRPVPSAVGRPAVPIDGDTFIIPSRARHPREAFRVMQQILSSDVQSKMARQGLLSPRKSVSRDPTLIDGSVPTPTIPEAESIISIIIPALEQMVAGTLSPKEGLDAVAVQLKILLSGAENR